jgi:hypothetical protein
MKLIKYVLLLTLFVSCKKEKTTNCGIVVSDNAYDYSVDIRNDKTNNVQRFYLSPSDWTNATVGSNYCITNVTSW